MQVTFAQISVPYRWNNNQVICSSLTGLWFLMDRNILQLVVSGNTKEKVLPVFRANHKCLIVISVGKSRFRMPEMHLESTLFFSLHGK